ncbi:Dabb family protein [Acidobacteria bacterium AH-259-D05]|nr:Dabb family protein [Acidobacteria bacterium AH-259-D05]
MKARTPLSLGIAIFISTFIFGFALAPSAQEADLAAQMPDGEGKGYVQTICTSCHGLGLIVSQRKTPVGWEATVYDMLGRISAGMDREVEIISTYLSANFGVETASPAGGNPASTEPAPADTGSQIQIYHQVVFRFKPDVTQEQIRHVLETGKKMLESIPEVAALVVGKVMQENSEYSYGLVTGFKNEEDLQNYRSHPAHREWLQETYRPLVEKSLVTDIIATQ